jgi:hypothetical protein
MPENQHPRDTQGIGPPISTLPNLSMKKLFICLSKQLLQFVLAHETCAFAFLAETEFEVDSLQGKTPKKTEIVTTRKINK